MCGWSRGSPSSQAVAPVLPFLPWAQEEETSSTLEWLILTEEQPMLQVEGPQRADGEAGTHLLLALGTEVSCWFLLDWSPLQMNFELLSS